MGSSGREEALGCWVGSLQAPRKSSAGGDVQESAWAPPVLRWRASPQTPPRPQSLLGLSGALGFPTGLSLRVPPPFAAPSLGWFFFLLLRTELRRTEQFALLFPLHAPVLKPDLDLPLGQAQGVRDLNAPPPG